MIVATARYVVSRTSAGGMAVRELAADGGRLIGYTVPGRDGWIACIRTGLDATPWAASQQQTAEDAEAALRIELGMPGRSPACRVCGTPVEDPDGCGGECVDDADITNYGALIDVAFGGGR